MPYNLRSGKQQHSHQDIDAALIMLKLHKEQADKRIMEEKEAAESIMELNKKKQELENLKLIKQKTDQYNTLTMLTRIHQEEADRLEIEISKLMSTIN